MREKVSFSSTSLFWSMFCNVFYIYHVRVLQHDDKNFALDVKDSRKVVSIDRVKTVFLPDNKNLSIAEPIPDFNQNLKNRQGRCINMPSKYKYFLLG